ncbi:MAG: sigma-70 family RNA polymerase sigma factor [Verrucomicrobiota bacterium]|jgi:RNA polymerase sigma factor (sigma-70 family)
MSEDRQWLAEFAQTGSEVAFRHIAGRYLTLVYSAALRMVNGDAALAQDITQLVFTNLARQARSLPQDVVLAGWLHRDTRFTALEWLRKERRRVQREQQAAAMNALETAGPEADWSHLRPVLDEVLDELDDPDRHAVLLRFFQQQTFAEVGTALGLTDEAARKRVDRALDGLRGALARRGVTSTAAGLAVLLGAHVVVTVPAALATTVASVSLAGAATAGGLGAQLIQLMTATKLKLIASVVVAAAVGTPLVMQHHANAALRAENTALREEAAQSEKLRAENQRLAGQMEAEAARPLAEHEELMRLRGEVGVLRRQLAGMTQTKPAAPAAQPPGKTAGYLTKDQLAFVGFATPETAFESAVWAIMNGNYDVTRQSMSPDMLKEAEKDPNFRAGLEAAPSNFGTLIKGVQMMAKKTLADDQVELKVWMGGQYSGGPSAPGAGNFFIQPLVKIGNEWKMSGSSRGVSPDWEQSGQVQPEAP